MKFPRVRWWKRKTERSPSEWSLDSEGGSREGVSRSNGTETERSPSEWSLDSEGGSREGVSRSDGTGWVDLERKNW